MTVGLFDTDTLPPPPGVGMTPSVSPTAPVLAPQSAPPFPTATPPAAPPSLWDRIGGALHTAGNNLFADQSPAGLFDPQTTANARRMGLLQMGLSMLAGGTDDRGFTLSLPQLLARGAMTGQQGYRQYLDQDIQRRQQAYGIAQMQHMMQARQQIGQMAQNLDPSDPQARIRFYVQAHQIAAAAGDFDLAKQYEGAASKVVENAGTLQSFPLGGSTLLMTKDGRVIGNLPHTPQPMSDDMKEFHQESLDMRRQQMMIAAAQRGDMMEMRRLALQSELDNRQFQHENVILTDYHRDAQDVLKGAPALRNAYAQFQGAYQGDPQAQLAFLASVIKAQHPNAKVARGEVAAAENGVPLQDYAGRLWQHVSTGAPLTRTQIVQLRGVLDHANSAMREAHAPIYQNAVTRAQRTGVDPSLLTDPFVGIPDPRNPATAAPRPNPYAALMDR